MMELREDMSDQIGSLSIIAIGNLEFELMRQLLAYCVHTGSWSFTHLSIEV